MDRIDVALSEYLIRRRRGVWRRIDCSSPHTSRGISHLLHDVELSSFWYNWAESYDALERDVISIFQLNTGIGAVQFKADLVIVLQSEMPIDIQHDSGVILGSRVVRRLCMWGV